jgi:segregation and condensation protein B
MMIMNEKMKVIEAALFISSRPLTLDYLGKVSGMNSLGIVRESLETLQKDYENKGLEIVKTPHGWSMQVRQDLLDKVAHLTPYYDLSEGCKRTLAIIAYKEPVKQSEIIRMQGNKAYSYIKSLIRKDLVRAEKMGHTKTLKLTAEFERYFGDEKEKIKEQLKGMIKEPKKEKLIEEKVEEESNNIEDKMGKIEKMFDIPENLKKKIKDDKPAAKSRKGKSGKKNKRTVTDKPKKDIKASHEHAFEELD